MAKIINKKSKFCGSKSAVKMVSQAQKQLYKCKDCHRQFVIKSPKIRS